MKQLSSTSTIEDLTGLYGQDWREGILSEHLHLATAAGLRITSSPSGAARWVSPKEGGRAIRVVCSEIIEVATEDGPVSGRCGLPATTGSWCEGHAEIVAGYAVEECRHPHGGMGEDNRCPTCDTRLGWGRLALPWA